MNTNPDIRLLIADDHEIFRDGFKLMLTKYPNIILVGEAENGKALIKLTQQLKPDVIVTDIKMPVMDGIEATKAITESHPNIGIIGLSMYNDDELIIDMLEAGAKGYLIKNAGKEQITEAIRTVYNHEVYYCKSTNHKLTLMIAQSRFNPYKIMEKPTFTEREIKVINFICQEYSNKKISEELCVSVRTIEWHRVKIMEKMKVKSMVGLVVYAIKNNIGTD